MDINPLKMRITWQREGNCMWHSDCEAYPKGSGIMIRIREEEKATLMRCGNCGKAGRYPVGGNGTICVDVVRKEADKICVNFKEDE